MPTGNLWGQATRLVLGAPASSRRVEGAKENHLHPGNHAQNLLSLSLPLSGSLSSPKAFLAAVAPFFENSRQRHYVSVHLLRLHGSRPFVLRAKEAGQARVDADDAHSILRLVLLFLVLRHPHHQSAVHRLALTREANHEVELLHEPLLAHFVVHRGVHAARSGEQQAGHSPRHHQHAALVPSLRVSQDTAPG